MPSTPPLADPPSPRPPDASGAAMRRSYALVMVVWAIVLAGLFVLQTSFP